MPTGVYSHRFISKGDDPAEARFTVPSGKRAIVTYCSAVSFVAATNGCDVNLAGKFVWLATLPAYSTANLTCRHVVYAGEQIVAASSGGSPMHIVVAGYLFDDLDGPLEDPAVGAGDALADGIVRPWSPR